jgi:hypothetical protein
MKKYSKNWIVASTGQLALAEDWFSGAIRDLVYSSYAQAGFELQMVMAGIEYADLELRQVIAPNEEGISYFPYIAEQSDVSFLPEGQLRDVIHTVDEYDDYGNVTRNRRESFDGSSAESVSSYRIDPVRWMVGTLTSSTTTLVDAFGSSLTRQVQFESDLVTGLLEKEIKEDPSAGGAVASGVGIW